jgi:hypothetical protein
MKTFSVDQVVSQSHTAPRASPWQSAEPGPAAAGNRRPFLSFFFDSIGVNTENSFLSFSLTGGF